MAEKMQPNPQEPQEKQKKFFSSVVKKLSPISAEDDIPANQSLLHTLWSRVSGGGKKAEELDVQEEAQPEEENPAKPFEKDHPLLLLRQIWLSEQESDTSSEEPWLPQDLLSGEPWEPVHRTLIEDAARLAMEMIQQGENQPVRSKAILATSPNGLTAYFLLLPPLRNGETVSLEQLHAQLEEKNITFGLLEENLKALAQPLYFSILPVAQGTLPVHGEDGRIEEVIPISSNVSFKEKENGVVDFREMNFFRNVVEGDVLCRILPPVPPQDGVNIYGAVIPAREGRSVKSPAGKNTRLCEDGQTIVAAMDGEVSFRGGQYWVEQGLSIGGSVDFSTGNLDVKGSVSIKGDVCEGFVVKATGDISVYGMIEGATLIAGGNIFAKTGMNGNNKGQMIAQGDIKCKFIENGVAEAKGDIFLESAIHATLSSQGSIFIKSGRGILVGGQVTAMKTIEATSVGNKSNRMTSLSIAPTEQFLQQKKQTEQEFRQTEEELEQIGLNLSPSNEEKLRTTALRMKQRKLKQQLEQMQEQCEELSMAIMRFNILHPNTSITIDRASAITRQKYCQCLVYNRGGEIAFGMK